jgi:hypothetical protein
VVGADGAKVGDFSEEAIVVDDVHLCEACRFSDTYFVSPQWYCDVDLSLPVLDHTTLGHVQHSWAGVAATSQVLGRHLPGRVLQDCGGLLVEGTMRTFVVVIPAELVAQFFQSLDRVSGTVVGGEFVERAVIPLKFRPDT